MTPFEQGYRRCLEILESRMWMSQHHQDMHRAWDKRHGVHPDDLAGYLAAQLHVRNLLRAELGMELIEPVGQLNLMGGVA